MLYAPNAFVDGAGRALMLAWAQELRSGGGFDYAGCLSLPRVLTMRGALLLICSAWHVIAWHLCECALCMSRRACSSKLLLLLLLA